MTVAQQLILIAAALFGLTGVTAGAFGAHLLKSKLSPQTFDVFEVAVRYQMYHALGLFTLVALMGFISSFWLTLAGWFFISGIFIFSGSLYLLVLTGIRAWGAVTPIGGLLLILGWLSILIAGCGVRAH